MMSSHNDSFAASGSSPTVDFLCENHGSLFLLFPLGQSAQSWVEEHLATDVQWFGNAVVIASTLPLSDHRTVIQPDIVSGSTAFAKHGSFCVRVRPAQAKRNRSAVVLSLDWKLFTAKVKSENFVVQIEQGDYCLSSTRARNTVADLRVDLGMGVKILVPLRTLYCQGRVVLELIRPDVRIVVRQPHSRRDRTFVVSRVKVPVVGRLPQQCRVSRPSEALWKTGLRRCVAVVRRDSHAI